MIARREQEQWRHRLELAREWNETDLAGEAERVLRGHLADIERFQEELDRVRVQKDKLKARVRAGRGGSSASRSQPSPPTAPTGSRRQAESKFRNMEVERDLNSLKERLKREMEE